MYIYMHFVDPQQKHLNIIYVHMYMNVHNIVTCICMVKTRQVHAMTCNSVFTIRLINVVTVQ